MYHDLINIQCTNVSEHLAFFHISIKVLWINIFLKCSSDDLILKCDVPDKNGKLNNNITLDSTVRTIRGSMTLH